MLSALLLSLSMPKLTLQHMRTLKVQIRAGASCVIDVPITIKVVQLRLADSVSMESLSSACKSTYSPHVGVPAGIGIGPDGLLLASLQALERLRPRNLKVCPCCGHEIVVSSSPDNVRI
jgi:hypothetical protein